MKTNTFLSRVHFLSAIYITTLFYFILLVSQSEKYLLFNHILGTTLFSEEFVFGMKNLVKPTS